MIVIKFGGSSVGTAEAILQVKSILLQEQRKKIVVCSAMSGVTNQLIELSNYIQNNNSEDANRILDSLHNKHLQLIDQLNIKESLEQKSIEKVETIFNRLRSFVINPQQKNIHSIVITSGEVLSTTIISDFLHSEEMNNRFLLAKDFMCISTPSVPDIDCVGSLLNPMLEEDTNCNLYITQGFIYQKNDGNICHLSRGGSDYSASIIGAAVNAEEVQIWTDVNGVLSNDPRFVSKTNTIQRLSYSEAAELAFFGAKILHPLTTYPLSKRKIPIQVLNTFDCKAIGTIISEDQQTNEIKGVAAKDDINLIDIEFDADDKSNNIVKQIFDMLDKYKVTIDMSSSSRTSILLAVRDNNYLEHIVKQIAKFCSIKLKRKQTIISIVGNFILSNQKGLKVFQDLNCSDVKMIMYGGSKNSILMLVDNTNKVKFLNMLNDKLFLA